MAGLNHSPQAGQTLAASQPLIYDNFITFIEPDFAVNHIGFNQGSSSGKHIEINLTPVTSPTFLGNEIGLYNVLDIGGFPVLNVVKTIAGPTLVTTDITTLTNTGSTGDFVGSCNIPSNLKMQWIQGVTGSGGTGLGTFTLNFTNVYGIYATVTNTANVPLQISASIYAFIASGTNKIATFNNAGALVNANYSILAIGVL